MLERTATERAAERLAAAGCVAAGEEAAELVAAAKDEAALDTLLARREQGEPLAWITGRTSFCGRILHVAPGVYVPRPQSEELALRAAGLLSEHGRAADLCTGTGAVASYMRTAKPEATVVGTDIDRRAVTCARRNGVDAVMADVDKGLRGGAFEVVTAIAPYVPTDELKFLPSDVLGYEPRVALDGGRDGLDTMRAVVSGGRRCLAAGGWLLTELGGEQDREMAPLLAEAGFEHVQFWHDEDGDLRGACARLVVGTGIDPVTSRFSGAFRGSTPNRRSSS